MKSNEPAEGTAMKAKRIQTLMLGCAMTFAMIVPVAAQDSTESPLVKQMYDGQYPPKDDYAKFKDQLFYQRAVDAYMLTLPALNTIGMRDGSEAKFGAGYNVLPVWKDRMNAKTWVPTPNADIIYSMSYLDLKKTGPLVVSAPPHVIGMLTDIFQRTLTDVGSICWCRLVTRGLCRPATTRSARRPTTCSFSSAPCSLRGQTARTRGQPSPWPR